MDIIDRVSLVKSCELREDTYEVSSELHAYIEAYRAAKIEALRVARVDTRVERDGHYDTDTLPALSATFTAVAEAERNAAIALADEILERTGRRCCA